MSFGEHVSNQKGEKSTIKVLIDEIIKEIEIRHGLVSFLKLRYPISHEI